MLQRSRQAAARLQGGRAHNFFFSCSSQDRFERKRTVDFGFQEVPVEEKQTLVEQVFSSVAPSYDVMNDLMSGGMHRLWKDRMVEALAPFAGMQHLDIAGGTGDVAFRVHRAIQDASEVVDTSQRSPGRSVPTLGKVTVCDINAAMLREGEARAAAQGIESSSISWVEGNAESLPFTDATFDACTLAFGIRNVTDRMTALREARRVLRHGGRFLCLEFSRVTIPALQQLYDLYSFALIPEVGRVVAGDAASYRYLVESIRRFPGQQEFAAMLQEAGFSHVRYENLTAGVVAMHSGVNVSKSDAL